MKFVKRPEVINAFQWNGIWNSTFQGLEMIKIKGRGFVLLEKEKKREHQIKKGDWLIFHIDETLSVMNDEIFQKTYKPFF